MWVAQCPLIKPGHDVHILNMPAPSSQHIPHYSAGKRALRFGLSSLAPPVEPVTMQHYLPMKFPLTGPARAGGHSGSSIPVVAYAFSNTGLIPSSCSLYYGTI